MRVLSTVRAGLLLTFIVGTLGMPAAAASTPAESVLDRAEAIRISQAVIGQQPANFTLLDRRGKPVRLSDYRGKPLLVSFIYTGCFQVCPTTTRMLHEAVQDLGRLVGFDKFNVVSIGFNQPFDAPEAMRAFATQNGIAASNWEFLSPHRSIVEPLTRDFGFSYVANAAGFDHVLSVTLLDGEGRIYSQIYGDSLTPNQLGEPMRELMRGAPLPPTLNLDDLIERVKILCTVYDPKTGQYRYDYGLFMELAGGTMFFLFMFGYLGREWLQQRRSRRL
ncbi:SCO family protein [Curvibacter sp. PAE-UM]|uniref:SCO family protein n=1 Tax=Curvibacter sp. PAE-UM TaxID=1714344 RepID=UPI00070C3E15|nr:SCO family protein [Curvibacter sp. PAE-UM]KRH99144.1 electron transporter SenC [Curvibacter sp. PAE-UM]